MLNPHAFPFAPHPGPAPELAARSATGNWEPYAQAGAADRLPPFVISRPLFPTQGRWLNCARVEHADTGALLFTLKPVGFGATPLASLNLPFRRYATPETEQFVYFGGQIPGLLLPCGVPVRVVIDNAQQSPRLVAVPDLKPYLQLDWWDAGPANGVPYGTGLRQRLYVEQAGLQFAEPTTQEETSKDPTGGPDRVDYLALTRTAVFAVPPVPAYLAEALAGARAVKHLTIDGETWQLKEMKATPAGEDGGRWTHLATVTQTQVLKFRASCPAPPPAERAYDAARDAPRPYRCGDVSDTAADFQPFGLGSCEADAGGFNTGFRLFPTRDQNPHSTTVSQAGPAVRSEFADATCPVPATFLSVKVEGFTTRNNCPVGETGSSVFFSLAAGAHTSRVSQADADAKASAAYAAQRQAFANANGVCSGATGPSFTPVYFAGGCFSFTMRNTADATDTRPATASEGDQYYRAFGDNGLPCER